MVTKETKKNGRKNYHSTIKKTSRIKLPRCEPKLENYSRKTEDFSCNTGNGLLKKHIARFIILH